MKRLGLRQAAALIVFGAWAIAGASFSCTPQRDSSFSLAGTSSAGLQVAGTETGNPRKPATAAASQVLGSICSVLNRCDGADVLSCTQDVQALDGMDAKLGLLAGSFDPFGSLLQAEAAGLVSASVPAADSCVSAISALECSDPRVIAAYQPSAPGNAFAGVVNLLPQGAGSCADVFAPASSPTFMQESAASLAPWTSATLTVTLNAPARAGDLMVVLVGSTRGVSPTAVSDNLGRMYASATSFADSQNHFDFYYALTAPAGVQSVTVSYPDNSNAGDVIVAEYSGLAAGGTLDQAAAYETTGAISSWSLSTPSATSASAEILVGAAFYAWSSNVSFTPGSLWTARATQCGSEGCLFLQDQAVSLPGSYLSTGSASTPMVTAGIATFR